MRRAALTFCVLLLASQANAANDLAAYRTAGDWRLSAVGGKVACTLTLTRQTIMGGFEVKAPLACRQAFPPLKDVSAWSLDDKGGIILANGRARPIVTFPAQVRGAYEAKAPDGRTWRLEPLKPTGALPGETPPTAAASRT